MVYLLILPNILVFDKHIEVILAGKLLISQV